MNNEHSERPSLRWPLILFVATWLSVFFCQLLPNAEFQHFFRLWQRYGFSVFSHPDWVTPFRQSIGLATCYAVPLMTILICHEAGHWFQMRRYGVESSFPLFIPMPISLIGTMGAVIRMDPDMPNRRALFDIGISGPLAGLIPTLIFCRVGLEYSYVAPIAAMGNSITFGEPLLFQWMIRDVFGVLPAGTDVVIHPIAFAGWTGLLLTTLNLFPISQLDGGHVLYAITPRFSHRIAKGIHIAAFVGVLVGGYWFKMTELFGWILMLGILAWMGTEHPPTQDDTTPLGIGRHILGWATLALIFLGFTPIPFR